MRNSAKRKKKRGNNQVRLEEKMKLEQTWTPNYKYCHNCGVKLKKGSICTTECWNTISKLKEIIKKRKKEEEGGVRLTQGKIDMEFKYLQSILS